MHFFWVDRMVVLAAGLFCLVPQYSIVAHCRPVILREWGLFASAVGPERSSFDHAWDLAILHFGHFTL
jgi:hypothetical protein